MHGTMAMFGPGDLLGIIILVLVVALIFFMIKYLVTSKKD